MFIAISVLIVFVSCLLSILLLRCFRLTYSVQMMTESPVDELYEPVLFRSDSSQRKNDVLIHQSKRFPDKCSEWYFVRRNKNTLNETYRCVHCRSIHEKERRRKNSGMVTESSDVALRPGARIIVHEMFFITNPDFPLGSHICDFENNPTSDAHVVWSRRALIRANSELRLNPEKPKIKFQKMLQSIEQGEGEYAYLSPKTRSMIVEHLTSKKGFDSRRRSFARNNSLALKRMREKQLRAEMGIEEEYEVPPLSPFDFNKPMAIHYPTATARMVAQRYDASFKKPIPTSRRPPSRIPSMKCGMPGCAMAFQNDFERANHRVMVHPEVFFIDSYDEFVEYRNFVLEMNGKHMDEVIITDFGRTVDIGMFAKAGGEATLDFFVADDSAIVSSINDIQCDVECPVADSSFYTGMQTAERDNNGNSSSAEQYHSVVGNEANAKSGRPQDFIAQIDNMLKQIHNCAESVANYPIRRDVIENTIYNTMHTCMETAPAVGNSFDDSTDSYVHLAEDPDVFTCRPSLPKRKRPNILSVQKV